MLLINDYILNMKKYEKVCKSNIKGFMLSVLFGGLFVSSEAAKTQSEESLNSRVNATNNFIGDLSNAGNQQNIKHIYRGDDLNQLIAHYQGIPQFSSMHFGSSQEVSSDAALTQSIIARLYQDMLKNDYENRKQELKDHDVVKDVKAYVRIFVKNLFEPYKSEIFGRSFYNLGKVVSALYHSHEDMVDGIHGVVAHVLGLLRDQIQTVSFFDGYKSEERRGIIVGESVRNKIKRFLGLAEQEAKKNGALQQAFGSDGHVAVTVDVSSLERAKKDTLENTADFAKVWGDVKYNQNAVNGAFGYEAQGFINQRMTDAQGTKNLLKKVGLDESIVRISSFSREQIDKQFIPGAKEFDYNDTDNTITAFKQESKEFKFKCENGLYFITTPDQKAKSNLVISYNKDKEVNIHISGDSIEYLMDRVLNSADAVLKAILTNPTFYTRITGQLIDGSIKSVEEVQFWMGVAQRTDAEFKNYLDNKGDSNKSVTSNK